MRHTDYWYAALAISLNHPGYVTLAEVRQAEAREARLTAAAAKWKHYPGGPYHTEVGDSIYVIHRDGRKWRIEAGPTAVPRYTRSQGGIATLADAKNLALNMPCFRCGLGAPLILMTPCLPARPSLANDPGNRWRCADAGPCEAERKRITGTEGGLPARIEIRQSAPVIRVTVRQPEPVPMTLTNEATGQSFPVMIDPATGRMSLRETGPGPRLEAIRTALRSEDISWGELHELQGLIPHIDPGDTELLEAAGVPEHPEG
jgi:hypothetical protein